MLNEAIVTVVRATGWSLEYVGGLPIDHFRTILDEITFQKKCETYQAAYNTATIVCTLASSEDRHYVPEDIIGEAPERRDMTGEPKLTQQAKLESITLADGKEYQLAPLTVNLMADLEDQFDKPISELFSGSVRMKVLRALFFARMKPNYLDMTEQRLGDLMTSDVLADMKEKLGV